MKAMLVTCLLASTAAADDLVASVHARIGSITAPFYTAAHPIVRSELQAYSLMFDGHARVRPRWWVGGRFAIATSSVQEPAGSYTADYTLGNALAYVEYDTSRIGRVRASVGLPLAGSGDAPSLVRNRVVAASDALEGWRSTELFQPGIVPVVLEAAIQRVRPAWRARARGKLAMLVRVADAGLPDARRFGLVPSTQIEVGWRARSWLAIGVGAHAVILAAPPIVPIRDVGRSGRGQLGIGPQLELVRGRAAFTLDVLAALAGPIDGVGVGASIAWHH